MARRDSSRQGTASLKLISLALALMLEIYFYSQDNSITRRISAVIEIQNIPDNRMILEPTYADEGIPAHIDIRGPRTIVDQLAMNIHKVRVNYPLSPEPNFSLDVDYDTLSLPPRVNILSTKPAKLFLRTVELVRKEVEVSVPTTGTVKEGFKLEKVKLFPDRIIIRGPLQEVQKVKKIELKEIDLSDLSESKRFELRVPAPDENTSTNINLVGAEIQISKIETTLEPKKVSDEEAQVEASPEASKDKQTTKNIIKTKN